jgi:hypothetical protein
MATKHRKKTQKQDVSLFVLSCGHSFRLKPILQDAFPDATGAFMCSAGRCMSFGKRSPSSDHGAIETRRDQVQGTDERPTVDESMDFRCRVQFESGVF